MPTTLRIEIIEGDVRRTVTLEQPGPLVLNEETHDFVCAAFRALGFAEESVREFFDGQ